MRKLTSAVFFIILSTSLFAQAPKNLTLLGTLNYPQQTLAGCWHYNQSSGKEYALVGAANGISIVDISNPVTPIELVQLRGVQNLWHEIKVVGDYAFAVTEGQDPNGLWNGVQIINLSFLPDSAPNYFYMGDGVIANQLLKGHSITASGKTIYVNGHNITSLGRGVLIIDVNDPLNPVYEGAVTNRYCHDSYIRGNTIYTSDIGDGLFSVYDISNPVSPVLLATQNTPGNFNHNAWLNDDGHVLFTTDERSGSPVGAFDISDLNNISLIDTFYNGNFTNNEAHNVRVINNFLINASYGSQVTIADAAYPDNIIETGSFVTGGSLCWDADPFPASGNIIVTDMNSGNLFILAPQYIRACYLVGMVTDSVTGLEIVNAAVDILSPAVSKLTDFLGNYRTGYADSGTYIVQYSKTGYVTKQISVTLQNGVQTIQNVSLVPIGSGLHEFEPTDVIVFPNPSSEYVNISSPVSITGWKITDRIGRLVAKSSDNFISGEKIQIDLNTLSAGSYSIELKSATKSILRTLVKK